MTDADTIAQAKAWLMHMANYKGLLVSVTARHGLHAIELLEASNARLDAENFRLRQELFAVNSSAILGALWNRRRG